MEIRKITYALYPNKVEHDALLDCLRLQKDLYNAALQERIDYYQKTGKGLSYNDQQASLTKIRADFPEYKALPVYLSRMTLKRLDISFKAFFSRVKKGQTADFHVLNLLSDSPLLRYALEVDGHFALVKTKRTVRCTSTISVR